MHLAFRFYINRNLLIADSGQSYCCEAQRTRMEGLLALVFHPSLVHFPLQTLTSENQNTVSILFCST